MADFLDSFEERGKNAVQYFPQMGTDQSDGLNSDQKEMVKEINKYLTTKTELPYFTVQGSGGTGKSYSILRAIQHINPKRILAAAPSHFAKNVLQDFLGEEYEVVTVAKLLGKRLTYDDTGKEVLIDIKHMKAYQKPINNFDLIIIDEVSMVEDDVAKEILSFTKNKKIIVMGDYCQLPPVKQSKDSLFFKNIGARLKVPMRFSGSIYNLTVPVRNEINKIREGFIPDLNVINQHTDRVSKLDDDGSGYIFTDNIKKLLHSAINKFKENNGTTDVRILAYRNKTIEKINSYVRKGLYGNSAKQFEKNEIVICNGGFSYKRKSIINNGEVFKVKQASYAIGPYSIPCVYLLFNESFFTASVPVVATEGKAQYERKLKELERSAKKSPHLWRAFYDFKESFARFNYSYATSIHKAQGSSITYVYLVEDDIFSVKPTTPKEKLQSLYVAISRTRFRLYIFNKALPGSNKNLTKSLISMKYEERNKV